MSVPTTSSPFTSMRGRQISLGSYGIVSMSRSSSRDPRRALSFLKDGLFQEKNSDGERLPIRRWGSSGESGPRRSPAHPVRRSSARATTSPYGRCFSASRRRTYFWHNIPSSQVVERRSKCEAILGMLHLSRPALGYPSRLPGNLPRKMSPLGHRSLGSS